MKLRLPIRRPVRVRRWLLALLILPFVGEALRVYLADNWHTVVPGQVYRCNQQSGQDLSNRLARHGVRTVVNLRGFCPGSEAAGWYRPEIAATNAVGASQEDVTFSAKNLPSPSEFRRLIEVLDRSERPLLIHCNRGIDRTGLASVAMLLLHSNATLDQALWQLTPRYGYWPVGGTAAMRDFYARYERWLAGRPTTPALFREWATTHYQPGAGQGELVPITPLAGPVGKWFSLTVRAVNASAEGWEFRPGDLSGVHVAYTVAAPDGAFVHAGQAGLFRKTVAPGETIDLMLAVPPLKEPGRYVIRADLIDARGASVPKRTTPFYKTGAQPLLVTLDVK